MSASPHDSTPTISRADTWTTRRLLAWIGDRFRERQLDSPRLCAEMLLSHVLGCDRISLYTDPDRPASDREREKLRDLVGRALRHEPIQYLVGEAWFFALPLTVTPAVLIPRPSTESLVEAALDWLRAREVAQAEHDEKNEEVAAQQEGREQQADQPGLDEAGSAKAIRQDGQSSAGTIRVADIGTGSGAIAIAIAVNHPDTRVIATDISAKALAVARINAERHGVSERLDFREGGLLAPFAQGEMFDLVVSNPPYVPDQEWPAVAANVREHEPAPALRGGARGLDVIAPLIAEGGGVLCPGGLLLLEHADSQAAEVRRLAHATGDYVSISTETDLEGRARFLRALRASL